MWSIENRRGLMISEQLIKALPRQYINLNIIQLEDIHVSLKYHHSHDNFTIYRLLLTTMTLRTHKNYLDK
ncbi:hypothetical protein M0802_009552 [Mischocyttarus mexicanus]|nr:hypothetical protein M0802_009552 [Mischocyttarus mexicanus]